MPMLDWAPRYLDGTGAHEMSRSFTQPLAVSGLMAEASSLVSS